MLTAREIFPPTNYKNKIAKSKESYDIRPNISRNTIFHHKFRNNPSSLFKPWETYQIMYTQDSPQKKTVISLIELIQPYFFII